MEQERENAPILNGISRDMLLADENGIIRQYGAVALGVAVALEEGLSVPVVRDAQRLSLLELSDAIRNRVSFGRLNLYDEPRVSLLGSVDVIFCRNVIIYFDDASKKTVINSFYNRIVDGGYLLLGHSESLISLSTQFKLRHLTNDMVYQKS